MSWFLTLGFGLSCVAVAVLGLLVPLWLWSWNRCRQRKNAGFPSAMIILAQSPGNHSPRAYAHGTAALKCGLVNKILFVAEPPGPLQSDPNVEFIPILRAVSGDETATKKNSALRSLKKLFSLGYQLYYALLCASRSPLHITHIVINTPPILPTLPLATILRPFLFPYAALVLDVHNLAFSLMRFTSSRFVVRVATALELISIRLCTVNANCWTVSYALANYLQRTVGVRSVAAVHDRPRSLFFTRITSTKEITINEIISHEDTKLYASVTHPLSVHVQGGGESEALGNMREKIEAIPMVVSSSSWTPDEDFSILLYALTKLDQVITSPLLVVLTGKGPGRQSFEARVEESRFRSIAVAFAWLPMYDYPRVLARAHVGICLHTSSSGLDLPMKAVDLLAAQTPVLALRYYCIGELVKQEKNGLLFDSAKELCNVLRETVFPETQSEVDAYEKLRNGTSKQMEDSADWDTCWQRTALPTLR